MSRQLREILFAAESSSSANAFDAIQEKLFLRPDDRYSRLDVYAAHLLAPKALPTQGTDVSDANENENANKNENENENDFILTEMESLRTADEISKYQCSAPGFRAFFITQRFSYSPLLISLKLFLDLLGSENISPQVKDFLIYYGGRTREVEIAPPVLKFRPLAWSRTDDRALGHECLYGLRFFEFNGRGTPNEPTTQWSLRQTAIYSRSCFGADGNVWLFTTISATAKRRLDTYVTGNENICLANSFEVHLLLLDTAVANWRFYLVALSKEIDEEVAHIAGTSSTDKGPINLFDANRRQHLIYLEEKVSTALLVARATVDTVETLSCHNDTLNADGNASIDRAVLGAGFAEQHRILNSTILRLETMKSKLRASTALLSSLLEQSSGHALEVLGQESRKENAEMRELSVRMHKLTEKATQDAAAVKVLTIMTLIYLPATVVSNFFSTSFVGTTSSPGSENHIIILADWWIFAVVSVPLTVLTLYIWWVWTRMKTHERYPWYLGFLRARPDKSRRVLDHDLENGEEKP